MDQQSNQSSSARVGPAIRAAFPFAILLAVYFALAFHNWHSQFPDKDEMITSMVMRSPDLGVALRDRFHAGHPPLYFTVLYGWVSAFGHTYPSMLMLSILLGAATVPLIVILGRELGLGRWAWAAGLLFCLHPTAQYMIRYARPWAGVLLIITAMLILILRQLKNPSLKSGVLLLATGVIGGAWSHSLLLVWAGLITAILLLPSIRRRANRYLWIAFAGSMASHLLFIGLCRMHANGKQPLAWIDPMTMQRWFEIGLKFLGGHFVESSRPGAAWLFPIASAAALIAAACWIFLTPRGDAESQWFASTWRMIAISTAFPWVLISVASWTVQPLMVDRYLSIMLPGAVLLMAWLVRRLARYGLPALALLAASAYLATSIQVQARSGGVVDCVKRINKQHQPGDVVIVFSNILREGVKLLSKRELEICLVNHDDPPEKGWKVFEQGTQNARRLWVIKLYDNKAIVYTPEWRDRVGKSKSKFESNGVEMFRYNWPPRPIAQSTQTSGTTVLQ